MAHVTVREVFEDLWDQMEELSKSCDRADGKLSRGIARHLVGYVDLPQSYRIRAHMALTSVLCAQDTLRDAEMDYAEVQAKVSTGRHAQIQAELHAELQAIREAYQNNSTEEWTLTTEDETVEDNTSSPSTTTNQLGPGSQEDPIDLTLEDDTDPENSTSDQSPADSGYVEGSDTMTERFSSSQSSMVIISKRPPVKALLTPLPALLSMHPLAMPFLPALTTPPILTCTSATNIKMEDRNNDIPVKGSYPAQYLQGLSPKAFLSTIDKCTRLRNVESAGSPS